ncbi:signal recognition particle 9 kDa protein-domain-containing protein [Xylariomycetidae sp. FL0641]|nr:signal recognition particle 9 kDa protein-domain-containing protein [Xylariomycetidae sp. FL0641]
MPYYKNSQDWLQQSSLLLEARPSTTRITTKYHISKAGARRRRRHAKMQADPAVTSDGKPPRGSLVLKTFDPASGVALKYRTTKAAEVSRLVLSLGRLGRRMAALPRAEEEDVGMVDAAAAAAVDEAVGAGKEEAPRKDEGAGKKDAGGGGGGGKKKKKGRK